MKANKLAGLNPSAVFGHFEVLCSMPHGSGNTKIISDYLVDFAKEHNLKYIQDHMNNVLIFKDGTFESQNRPPVILQGHMDMVCEKDPDCKIDFQTEGLDVTHDDHVVYAQGTTLGGDDGIAVAYCLALLESDSIQHPPLEVLFTVDEETGMYGAEAVDLSCFHGKRMINLDSEEEGIFTVACAGGASAHVALPISRHAVYGPCIRLEVKGLAGGHSGVEINKNRANSNKVMGMLLGEIKKRMPLCLTAISGGSKDNAIPRSTTVNLVAMGMDIEQINDIAQQLQEEIRRDYAEPDAVILADNIDALGGNALSTGETDKIIGLLCGSPNGVQSMCETMPELVQTSLNLGIVSMSDTSFEMTYSVRSSVEQEKADLLNQIAKLAQMYDAVFSTTGDYPAWEYRSDSPLRDVMVSAYDKMYGEKPQVVSIHAGLECGLFNQKIKDLDAVSIGPWLHDVHTSRETMEIASVERVWNYLLEVLKNL